MACLRLRFGVDISDESGYVDNYKPTATGAGPDGSVLSLGINDSTGVLARRDVNDIKTQVFRVSGKYAPSDDLTVTPAYFWQRTDAADSALQYPALGLYDQDKRVAEPGVDTLSVPSLTIVKNFGWAELTSISSYFERNFHRTTDGTYYNSNIFFNYFVAQPTDTAQQAYNTATVLAFLPSPVYYRTITEQLSQEVRLSSQNASIAGMPVTWTAGFYFSNQHQTHLDDEYIPGLGADFLKNYGYAIDSAASPVGPTNYPGVSFANDSIYYGHVYPDERQLAPFGEVGFQITPDLKATSDCGMSLRSPRTRSPAAASILSACPCTTPTKSTSAPPPQVFAGLCHHRFQQCVCHRGQGISLRGPHRSRSGECPRRHL
jgi:hypothetical protein